MMQKGVFFLIIVFLLTSCSVNQEPIFVNVDTIKIVSLTSKTVSISALAHFKNPNEVSGKFETKGVKVLINDVEMATVKSKVFEVPAKNEFIVPMLVEIPFKELQKKLNVSFLESFAGAILSKKLEVTFKGQLKYKVLGYSSYYEINQSEKIKIKL